jgi:hypothetical protein
VSTPSACASPRGGEAPIETREKGWASRRSPLLPLYPSCRASLPPFHFRHCGQIFLYLSRYRSRMHTLRAAASWVYTKMAGPLHMNGAKQHKIGRAAG